MTKPSKQQIASVKAALREIDAELLGWDPHVLVLLNDQAQKAQIIARMSQLGWHYVDDPSNETDDVSMVEFSLDDTATRTASAKVAAKKLDALDFPRQSSLYSRLFPRSLGRHSSGGFLYRLSYGIA